MDVPYSSFLSSEPFRIEGPGGTTFYVHGGLITQHSATLAKHVNGPMMEARTKCIHIEDVDGDVDDDTIMRFIEYCYTAEYTVAKPDVILTSEDIALSDDHRSTSSGAKEENQEVTIPVEQVEPEGDDIEWFKPIKKKTKKSSPVLSPISSPVSRSKRERHWSSFQSKATIVPPKASWEPLDSDDECEDYTPVFLCHARLYVFSNRYECDGLASLVLQRLRLTLSRFSPLAERVPGIVTLIKYVYTHTQEFKGKQDRLRKLVIDYTACQTEIIMADAKFKAMLQEAGPLAKDLILRMLKRLD